MAPITIHFPDDVVHDARTRAKRAGITLSAYRNALAARKKRSAAAAWPKHFLELLGSWEGAFPRPHDPAPQDDLDVV